MNDIIEKLPGYKGKLPSKTYGGYINLGGEKNTFYMFIECEKNPREAPIMFWTNGGPGCSGLMGLFEEFGPYRPERNGTVSYNRWTWTKFANIVFVEQPIGVGFSWSGKKKDYTSNDKLSAKDNFRFVMNFFEKYPHYKKNNMYLISESYGGHYVPLWAKEVIEHNKKHNNELNFKGFMIGNPYINFRTGTETQIETYWGHQKIPKHLWDKFTRKKCNKVDFKKTRKISKSRKRRKYECNNLTYKIEKKVGLHNPYAIDYPLCMSNQMNQLIMLQHKKNKTVKKVYKPCLDQFTKKYLNRKDVQKAINAKHQAIKWKPCSDITKYRYGDSYNSQVPLINKMLNDKELKHLHVFIMSGTNDAICGTVGTQHWIQRLNIKDHRIWKQYFVHKEPAGYISTYKGDDKKRFIFATVNFAGHEIPMYKPQAAYELMEKFVKGHLTK